MCWHQPESTAALHLHEVCTKSGVASKLEQEGGKLMQSIVASYNNSVFLVRLVRWIGSCV